MNRVTRSFAAGWLTAICLGATAIAGPATQPVDDAVAHLADADPAARDRAARTLRDAGPAARAALEAAANGDDPEIAGRARKILAGIPTVSAETSADADPEMPEITRYRASAPAAKRLIITELAGNETSARALARLWAIESNSDLRKTIFEELLKEPAAAAGALLGDGNVATAELLLQAAVDGRSGDAPQAYAAYWLCRGRIDAAIRHWSSRGGKEPPDVWAEQVLSELHRAKGDTDAAVAHAEAVGDADFLRRTLSWAGSWKRISAELHQDKAAQPPTSDLRLQMGIAALAGDAHALSADLEQLAARSSLAGEAHLAANTMLLVDRPVEAIKLLVEAQQLGTAYEVMITRSRFDDAAALLTQHEADTTQEAMLLRCTAAKCLARLGQKAVSAAMIDRVARENADAKFPRVFELLAEAERAVGLKEQAWEHFADAIEAAPGNNSHLYISRAFGPKEFGVDWPGLWYAAMRQNPARPVRALFQKMRRIYDRTMPLDELVTIINGVDLSSDINRPYIDLAWETARRCKTEGSELEAVQFASRSAERADGGELYIHLGDWAAEKKDWASAADRYAKAWQKDRTKALPLYLRGWALLRAGQIAEGLDRIELAHILPLSDETQRQELIKGLAVRGLDEAAAREADVMIHTAQPLSAGTDIALRLLAEHLCDRGEFAAATDLLQRSTLDFMTGTYGFFEESMYLYLPNMARRTHARALLAAGDWEGAQREIARCQELLPDEIFVAIDLVPQLDKLGKRAEADAMFDKTFAEQEALCARFPDSPNAHNQIAWVAAMCHRQLDKALDHARRAVDLDPKRTAYIDTLAEVYYQRGQFAESIAQWRKCVELEPEVYRHRKQIERSEKAMKP